MPQTPPELPSNYLATSAQLTPRYLRGRASIEIIHALKSGRLTSERVRKAILEGEEGVARLMIENALPQTLPRLGKGTFDANGLTVSHERREELHDMLMQLYREGDLTGKEAVDVKNGSGFRRWLFLMVCGLNRRITRLLAEIPNLSSEDYAPLEVMPEALALTPFDESSGKGEVRIQLGDTPFVLLSDDTNEAMVLFQGAAQVLQKIPSQIRMVMSPSQTFEMIGGYHNEIIQDVLPHYRMYGANTAMYPEFIQQAIEEFCDYEIGVDEWIRVQMSLWDEVQKIEKTPGDVSKLSEAAKEKHSNLQLLTDYLQAHPFPEEKLTCQTSEDGDYPVIYPLTSSMENELIHELSNYGAEGMAYHKVARPNYDPEKPLEVFDLTIRAVAIQNALMRTLI